MPALAGEMVTSFGSRINPFSKGDERLREPSVILHYLNPSQFREGFKADYSKRHKQSEVIHRSRSM